MTDITGGTGVTDMTGRRAASFADQLRQRREGAGLTQEELAERAGLTPNAISALAWIIHQGRRAEARWRQRGSPG